MSSDNGNQGDNANNGRPRRGSFTANTFGSIFGRSNSVAAPQQSGVATQPSPGGQQRRMSITTLGLSGTAPIQQQTFNFDRRRASVSTAGSDSIDENAIDDEEGPSSRSIPTTPFGRRMSFGAQALFAARPSGSPGTSAEGLNWSEQFRSRAESTVSRPSFSTSPSSAAKSMHERTKSVSEMPVPPSASLPAKNPSIMRTKPDEVGERMLRGQFYMD